MFLSLPSCLLSFICMSCTIIFLICLHLIITLTLVYLVYSLVSINLSINYHSFLNRLVETFCGPVFFTCAPTCWRDSLFNDGKFVLVKSKLPLILFYFKRENKTRKKTLKKCDSIVLEKHIFKKPKSKFGDQVTYREGTSKR